MHWFQDWQKKSCNKVCGSKVPVQYIFLSTSTRHLVSGTWNPIQKDNWWFVVQLHCVLSASKELIDRMKIWDTQYNTPPGHIDHITNFNTTQTRQSLLDADIWHILSDDSLTMISILVYPSNPLICWIHPRNFPPFFEMMRRSSSLRELHMDKRAMGVSAYSRHTGWNVDQHPHTQICSDMIISPWGYSSRAVWSSPSLFLQYWRNKNPITCPSGAWMSYWWALMWVNLSFSALRWFRLMLNGIVGVQVLMTSDCWSFYDIFENLGLPNNIKTINCSKFCVYS